MSVFPFFQSQQFFTQWGKFGYRILFFPFQRVAGECKTLHSFPACPAVDAPLPEFFIFFLGRHHSDILGDSYLVLTGICPYSMRLQTIEY